MKKKFITNIVIIIIFILVLVIILLRVNEHRLLKYSIEKGILALVQQQQADGSWKMYKRNEDGIQLFNTVFSTCNILLSVGYRLPESNVQKAIDFILNLRYPSGYWDYGLEGVPIDSDDTSCCIACIAIYRPTAIVIERDISLLRSFWQEPSGPFSTWNLTTITRFFKPGPTKYQFSEDQDAVVNANILLAYFTLGVKPPQGAIEKTISLATQKVSLWYTPGILSTLHALRRCGIDVSWMLKDVYPSDKWNNIEWAHWLYVNQEEDRKDIVRCLLNTQQSDGSWFYNDWNQGCGDFWGSSSVTTAFCLEALINYEKKFM